MEDCKAFGCNPELHQNRAESYGNFIRHIFHLGIELSLDKRGRQYKFHKEEFWRFNVCNFVGCMLCVY